MRTGYHILTRSPRWLTAAMVVWGLAFWMTSASAQVAVIVHPSVPVDMLSEGELLDVYAGEIREWDDGQAITVFDLKPRGAVKDVFYKYLGKSPSRMKSIWMVNMLSGEGDPPESFETEEALVEKVATTPGAIGFVSAANLRDDVKVLTMIEAGG